MALLRAVRYFAGFSGNKFMMRKILLGILAGLAVCHCLSASPVSDTPLTEVIYDGAEPDLSVAAIGGELYQLGDIYEDAQILNFYPNAIILKNLATSESVKCPVFEAPADTKLHQRALNLFISKQMKAIYEAQTVYNQRFGDSYAPKLDVLVEQGLLKGFQNGIKVGYFFEIAETGKTKRLAIFPGEASFKAMAAPMKPEEGALYFSVDQRGEVRYAENRFESSWGPVWEYNDPTAVPIKKIIREV